MKNKRVKSKQQGQGKTTPTPLPTIVPPMTSEGVTEKALQTFFQPPTPIPIVPPIPSEELKNLLKRSKDNALPFISYNAKKELNKFYEAITGKVGDTGCGKCLLDMCKVVRNSKLF